jgi:sec-independent protein translocase protein TatC
MIKRFPRKLKADEKIPFTTHLEELRYRIIVCLIAVAIGFVLSYLVKERIFSFLMDPLLQVLPEDQKYVIFTGLPEAFFTYLKLSLFGGLLLGAPVILYQVWAFVVPGLYANEKRYFLPFVFFSTLFFFAGTSFCFYMVFPFGFRFFTGFGTEHIHALPAMKEYLSIATKLLLAFGIVFEMPLFTFFLAKIGLVNHKMMLSKWRYAVVIMFVGAAVFTPPDVFTQVLMAGPLILIYFISVGVARVFGKKEAVEEEDELSAEAELEKG